MKTLTGQTVTLIPMETKHVEPLYEASKREEIWEWIATKLYSFEDVEKFVQRALSRKEEGRDLPYVVVENASQKVIGSTRFCSLDLGNLKGEIGFTWYHPDYWGTGVNTECKLLLLQHAFEEMDLVRVEFKTDERNARSRKAITKIGGQYEGILRNEQILADGTVRNTALFSIIDTEWEEVKKRLST